MGLPLKIVKACEVKFRKMCTEEICFRFFIKQSKITDNKDLCVFYSVSMGLTVLSYFSDKLLNKFYCFYFHILYYIICVFIR